MVASAADGLHPVAPGPRGCEPAPDGAAWPAERPWLAVADLPRALRVYLDLGYEVARAADGWLLLAHERVTFVLARDTTSPPLPPSGSGPGTGPGRHLQALAPERVILQAPGRVPRLEVTGSAPRFEVALPPDHPHHLRSS